MSQIHEIALKKALHILDAINCDYHIAFEGKEFGKPVGQKPKKGSKYGYGNITFYIKPFIDPLKKGETVSIPFGDFDKNSIQSCVSSMVCRVFGKGSCITTRNNERQTIEVLRVQ